MMLTPSVLTMSSPTYVADTALGAPRIEIDNFQDEITQLQATGTTQAEIRSCCYKRRYNKREL